MLVGLGLSACRSPWGAAKGHYDYRIDIVDSGTYVYAKRGYVGFVPFDSICAFDQLMLKDNQ